jgi:C1A family cysteine protease
MAQSKINRNYGWLPERPSLKLNKFLPELKPESELPVLVDMRSQFPECFDQGQLGSCTANAIAGLIQHRLIVSNYKWKFVPSRLFIYFNERKIEGTINSDAGAMISDGINSVNTYGVCPEDNTSAPWCWSYDDNPNDQVHLMPPRVIPAKFKQQPPEVCYKDAILHKSLNSQNVSLDRATVLNTLAQGLPFCFGFTVYESFESQETINSGVMSVPTASEQILGGHAVVCAGYSLGVERGTQGIKDFALIRNSWGTKVYGDLAGYFWMPLTEILCNSNMTSDAHYISLLSGEEHKA